MKRGQGPSAERVVLTLRQIEVQTAQGKSIAITCMEAHVSEQSYYRRRKQYGGPKVGQAKKMRDLERENARLRRPVADLSAITIAAYEVDNGKPDRPRVATVRDAAGRILFDYAALVTGANVRA